MTIHTEHTETPSQELARQIIARLVAEGLISAKAGEALQPKLAEGKLRGEDWRLPIELGDTKERAK